jgi:anaerobic ribonucleoside-triphosphate reductase activating protein
MNYAGIKYCDVANGLGCRTVLFVSGCRNACRGCFQPETWDFCYGEPFDEEVQQTVIDSLAPDYIEGITLLGGEPFEEENQEALVLFMRKLKARFPDKNVWAFTGYIYDRDLIEGGRKYTKDTKELLSMIDVLVDGPYCEEQKNLMLRFRGSSNQRILDLQKTINCGRIVLFLE